MTKSSTPHLAVKTSKPSSVNIPMLLRIGGILLIIESVFMIIPLIAAISFDEPDLNAFLLSMAISAVTGILLLTTIKRPRHTTMRRNDGILLTASIWIILSLFGMLPFMLCSLNLSVTDAFFEAMSGFTTTGASAIPSVESAPRCIVLWRCVMQWIGGLGIIIFTLAVVPMLNHSGGLQMFNAEITGITHDKIKPRISQTAKSLWAVYILLTLTLFVLLVLGPMNAFESLCHAFATVSTGGYSTADLGVHSWESIYIEIVLTVFMVLGGANFALIFRAAHGDWKEVRTNEVFRMYLGLIVAFALMFSLNNLFREGFNLRSGIIEPLFQTASIITSTGYMAPDFGSWGAFAMMLIIPLMLLGGCAGSTSGGAKIDRIIIVMRNLRNELYRVVHPNCILSVRLNAKTVMQSTVNKVIAFLSLYLLITVVAATALSAMGIPMVDAFFSSFSCIGNTGLGSSVTGYSDGMGFESIPAAGKWLLSVVMLTGRLEIFTVVILLSPGFWRR